MGRQTLLYRSPMPETHNHDWYDFPRWYDILHAPGTKKEVAGLWRLARRFNPTPHRRGQNPRWLEPACGSGRYLIAAVTRGVRGLGIDLNPRMIRYAKERSRLAPSDSGSAAFRVGDMTRLSLKPIEKADFAFCLINSARHLMSDRAMLDHLDCVARALRPGGVYALGLSMTAYAHEFASEDVWVGRREGVRVHQLVQYLPPDETRRRERVISHLSITGSEGEHHIDSVYDLRSYSGEQWGRLLARSAMECIGVVDELGDDLPSTRSSGAALEDPGSWFSSHASGYALFVLRPRVAIRARSAQLKGSSRVRGRSRR